MIRYNRFLSACALLWTTITLPGCLTDTQPDNAALASAASAISVSPFVQFNGAAFELPEGLVIDRNGDFFVSIVFSGEIKKVSKTGVVSSYAQLPGPHTGFSAVGMVLDKDDNLYVARATFADETTGVYRISANGTTVTKFASLPIGIPNAMTFDKAGQIYVTDSLAGAIWRIDQNGQPTVWVQHPLLAGEAGPPLGIPVGANGIVFDRGRRNLYVAVTDLGRIVRVPINRNGSAGTPEVFVENLATLKGVDGMAFDKRGYLYSAVNRQDRLVRISPSGSIETIAEGSPLDFPATPVFGKGGDNKTLFVTNFALFRARGFLPGSPAPSILKINLGNSCPGGDEDDGDER